MKAVSQICDANLIREYSLNENITDSSVIDALTEVSTLWSQEGGKMVQILGCPFAGVFLMLRIYSPHSVVRCKLRSPVFASELQILNICAHRGRGLTFSLSKIDCKKALKTDLF